jgi:hypothetical protein
MAELTRKAFYDLAHECRAYAMRLATHDQDSVDRALCKEWNAFLPRMREFDQLRPHLAQLQPARGITRVMAIGGTLLVYFFLVMVVARLVPLSVTPVLLGVSALLVFGVVMIPPAAYGTSVEAIEGRVLVVVEALESLLDQEQFTEAAYFAVRDVLREAAAELRQQVSLNRPSTWR